MHKTIKKEQKERGQEGLKVETRGRADQEERRREGSKGMQGMRKSSEGRRKT